jgi:hypothetical protein
MTTDTSDSAISSSNAALMRSSESTADPGFIIRFQPYRPSTSRKTGKERVKALQDFAIAPIQSMTRGGRLDEYGPAGIDIEMRPADTADLESIGKDGAEGIAAPPHHDARFSDLLGQIATLQLRSWPNVEPYANGVTPAFALGFGDLIGFWSGSWCA